MHRPLTMFFLILATVFAQAWAKSDSRNLSGYPVAPQVVISVQSNGIHLYWTPLPGKWQYEIQASASPEMFDPIVIAVTGDTFFVDSRLIEHELRRQFYCVIARDNDPLDDPDYRVIESFEEPVTLTSYSVDEDLEPDSWQRVVDGEEAGAHSLELFGNTWKRQAIDPLQVGSYTVWQLLAKSLSEGNIQAFGIADSANEMWYQIWGETAVDAENWNAAYTGWYPQGEWFAMDLPVAEDWEGRFGYLPRVLELLYANDNDDIPDPGVLRIDEIRDLSLVVHEPQLISINWALEGTPHPDSVDVALMLSGVDADNPPVEYFWTLGDGSYSRAGNLIHRYAADQSYKVVMRFREANGQAGWATTEVDCGEGFSPREFSMITVGDVMIARRYISQGIIEAIGTNGIFEPTRDLILSADLAMCNLECTFTNATEVHPTKEYTFKGLPEYLPAISYAGFDFCALGNNHNMDYLYPGMVETKFLLDSLGLLSTGAGANDLNAREPEIYSLNGLSAAILSFCNRDGVEANEQPFLYATRSRPGFAMWNRTQIEQSIPVAADVADLVIIQSHSGTEYATAEGSLDEIPGRWDPERHTFELIPDTADVDLRRYAIEVGADIVINHHPHVVQGIETYNGKYIAHSMGNFAFDQRFPETFYTMALRARLSAGRGIGDLEVVPIYIQGYVPGVARGYLAERILDHITELSRPMETLLVREPGALTAHAVQNDYNRHSAVNWDTAALEARDAVWISAPRWIAEGGYPVEVSLPDSLMEMDVRVGRAVFWMGNFEDEGAQPWLFNSDFESLDSTQSHTGDRCGRIIREPGQFDEIGTLMMYRIPFNPAYEHSAIGWISTVNGNNASLSIRFYQNRSSGGALAWERIGPLVNNDTPWQFYWKNLDAPENTNFYNFWFSTYGRLLEPVEARFDDIELIRWEPWQQGSAEIPFPSNVTHVQFRSATERDTVVYRLRNQWQPVDDTWPVGG